MKGNGKTTFVKTWNNGGHAESAFEAWPGTHGFTAGKVSLSPLSFGWPVCQRTDCFTGDADDDLEKYSDQALWQQH